MDLTNYKRLFCFGCSMTSYFWPTWADILAQEFVESYNYGQSGAGNLFISNQIVEANQRYRFNQDDLIMIMWSSVCREDRWIKGNWHTPGNIFTQNFYDYKFVNNYCDPKGYLIRDLAIIASSKYMLDALKVDYHVLSMSPFINLQGANSPFIENSNDITDLYTDILTLIKPDIFTVGCDQKWPATPILVNGKQDFDYHPIPSMHLRYLKIIFPNISFRTDIDNFIKNHNNELLLNLDRSNLSWLKYKKTNTVRF